MQGSDLLIRICTVLKIVLNKKLLWKKHSFFNKCIKHADLTLTFFVVDVTGLCYSMWLLMAWLMNESFHDQKIFLKSSGKWLSALMRLERVTKQLLLKRLRHSLISCQKYEKIFIPIRINVQLKSLQGQVVQRFRRITDTSWNSISMSNHETGSLFGHH